MLIPVAYILIFGYAPLYGILMAFQNFSITRGIWGSKWIGIENFTRLFESVYLTRIVRNTLLLGIYGLLWSFPIPIIFGLAINEIRFSKLKRSVQTISYVPYFISTVIVVGIMYNLFSVNYGVVNKIITSLGFQPINFFLESSWFRTLFIGSNIWSSFGFSSVLFIASISGIDPQLYEACDIDGGNRLRRIWHITLPSIRPTIVISLILGLGGIFSVGAEKIILMYSPEIYDVSDVIGTYVYRVGLINNDFGFATAVGLLSTVVNFLLLVIFNFIARKVGETSLF